MKLYLYINNAESFLQQDFKFCFQVSTITPKGVEDHGWDDWTHCGEVDVDIDIDEQTVRQRAIDALTAKQQQIRAATEIETGKLEHRKQNLLALTAPGAK